MNKLSDRLQLIANKINEGETMADIGTDHGFLPIYMAETGKSPFAIMGDVSGPSLEKGKRNARMMVKDLKTLEKMDFRVGDGLKVLNSGEVDAVVIAGMGGKLIRDIMAADIGHTCSFKKFILQPRIGEGHLRKWLVNNGFKIISEDVVIEGDYIPEVITAISPGHDVSDKAVNTKISTEAGGDDMIWKIPPWMAEAGGPVGEFFDRFIGLEEEKLDNVRKAKTRNLDFEESISKDIEYLRTLRKEWENGF